MKFNKIKYAALAAALAVMPALSACGDFLDRPAEDSYTGEHYYQDDSQCMAGTNFLYGSPWFDFARGFLQVGDVMPGNIRWDNGNNTYWQFTVTGNNADLRNMSASLWSIVAYTNVIYYNLSKSPASEQVRNACMGECLTFKALAYFYLVRIFGDVPIVHNNMDDIGNNSYNDKYKVLKADVYEYIVMTLEKALELLPKQALAEGRIDYYSAKGLLAKVYLAMSGVNQSGSRDQSLLDKAAAAAKDVIDNSGRQLESNYSQIFRLTGNFTKEALISWRWAASNSYTSANCFQQDLGPQGLASFNIWGQYRGPSVDLQDQFNISVLTDPAQRVDLDARRKATFMLPGDFYDYMWTDKGGFDPLKFSYDPVYGKGSEGKWGADTGAYNVKHCYGNTYDHEQAIGIADNNYGSSLATHVLRLADIYLIYAEAVLGNNASTSDANALAAFNAVRGRAIAGMVPYTAITFNDIWKERRLELAMEGDRWYDYVRRAYYDPQGAIDDLKSQRRGGYWNLDQLYKYYYETGIWDIAKAASSDPNGGEATYNDETIPNVNASSFTIPFPAEDVVFNPHLLEDPIHMDVRSEFSY